MFNGHSINLSVSGLDFPLSFQKNFEPTPLRVKVLSSNPLVLSPSESVVSIILSESYSIVKSRGDEKRVIVELFSKTQYQIFL